MKQLRLPSTLAGASRGSDVLYCDLNKAVWGSGSGDGEALNCKMKVIAVQQLQFLHSTEKVFESDGLSACEENAICLFLLARISAGLARCISQMCISPHHHTPQK